MCGIKLNLWHKTNSHRKLSIIIKMDNVIYYDIIFEEDREFFTDLLVKYSFIHKDIPRRRCRVFYGHRNLFGFDFTFDSTFNTEYLDYYSATKVTKEEFESYIKLTAV